MALSIDPKNADLLYNIGQCYDREGDWKQAEVLYCTCLDNDPHHADSRFALAALMYETDRKSDAVRLIEQWLSASPKQADPYVLDGWRLRQEGATIDAMARLQQGLARDPNHVRGLLELGIIYEQLDHPARALALYERALAVNPNQPDLADRVRQLRSRNVGPPLPD